MTLTVGVDLDGTCYPVHAALARWAQTTHDVMLPVEPTCWYYWREQGMTDGEWFDLLTEFGEGGGYRCEAPYPEALKGMVEIFDAGHDVLAVTSRPATRQVETSTFGWVADWFLPFRAVLIGPTAKLEVECDLVVDDNPEELARLEELGETVGVLLDRSWNRDDERFGRVTWSNLPRLVEALSELLDGEPPEDRSFALEDWAGLLPRAFTPPEIM